MRILGKPPVKGSIIKYSQPRILISRTDAIGDVVLTLPLATILKQHFPQAHIGFLGKPYTAPVIECCSAVDEFVAEEDFLAQSGRKLREQWDVIIHVFPKAVIARKARRAGISMRIGTSSRPYHWTTCNRLVKLSRRHSPLHEAQLNTALLAPLGITQTFSKEELGELFSFTEIPALPPAALSLLHPGKRRIILHPKSAGSAREWGLEHFATLVHMLPHDRFQIFISGTDKDRAALQPLFDMVVNDVTDIAGMFSLCEFIAFIAQCDALVAASTGPLHIAAALGKVAVGLYPPIRPMHAGRWGPLGADAAALSLTRDCTDCKTAPMECHCMGEISVREVAGAIRSRLG